MEIEPGEVRLYPYLWVREQGRGETEGRKDRRCVLVSVIRTAEGARLVFVLPITSLPPRGDEAGVPVPAIEARRGGLDSDRPLWVMVDEVTPAIPTGPSTSTPKGARGARQRPLPRCAQRRRDRAAARAPAPHRGPPRAGLGL